MLNAHTAATTILPNTHTTHIYTHNTHTHTHTHTHTPRFTASHNAKKKQHACGSSGLHDHYCEVMEALKLANAKPPLQISLSYDKSEIF